MGLTDRISLLLYLYSMIYYSYCDQKRQTNAEFSLQTMNRRSNTPDSHTSNSRKENVFAVPMQLRENYEIIIRGNMLDGMLDIELRPNNNQNQHNIVCQLNIAFPENGQSGDGIAIRNVKNGHYYIFREQTATNYFNDTSFDIRFIILPSALRISVGVSYLETIPLQHTADDIKFISVRGDVKWLSFALS